MISINVGRPVYDDTGFIKRGHPVLVASAAWNKQITLIDTFEREFAIDNYYSNSSGYQYDVICYDGFCWTKVAAIIYDNFIEDYEVSFNPQFSQLTREVLAIVQYFAQCV